jgi:hypothetical protein
MLVLLIAGCTAENNVGNEPPSPPPVTDASAVGSTRWAISIGTAAADFAIDVAIDSIGDVVAAGNLGSIFSVESSGYGFVTKRAAFDGSERWTVNLVAQDATSNVWVRGVAVAPDDSITVVGDYMGTVDLGGQTLALSNPNTIDAFVATYDVSGSLESVRGLAGASTLAADIYAVAIDSTGALVLGADFQGTIALGSASYTSSGIDNDYDYYVAEFDPSGSVTWSHELGDPVISSITIDASDDVWIAGNFGGSESVGGAVLDADAYSRGFVSEFRKDGLYLESYAVGASSPAESDAVALVADPTGDVVVSTIDQMPPPALAQPALYAFDTDAAPTWSTSFPHSPGRTLIATADGRYASLGWADTAQTGAYQIITLDGDGNSSTTSYGERDAISPDNTGVIASAINASGAVATIGNFGGTIDFGTGPLTDGGAGDVFVVLSNPP